MILTPGTSLTFYVEVKRDGEEVLLQYVMKAGAEGLTLVMRHETDEGHVEDFISEGYSSHPTMLARQEDE